MIHVNEMVNVSAFLSNAVEQSGGVEAVVKGVVEATKDETAGTRLRDLLAYKFVQIDAKLAAAIGTVTNTSAVELLNAQSLDELEAIGVDTKAVPKKKLVKKAKVKKEKAIKPLTISTPSRSPMGSSRQATQGFRSLASLSKTLLK